MIIKTGKWQQDIMESWARTGLKKVFLQESKGGHGVEMLLPLLKLLGPEDRPGAKEPWT